MRLGRPGIYLLGVEALVKNTKQSAGIWHQVYSILQDSCTRQKILVVQLSKLKPRITVKTVLQYPQIKMIFTR